MKMPQTNNSVMLMVDMQEKLMPVMFEGEKCIKANRLLLEAAAAMELPVVVSEQYPKGLGSTIPELKELFRPEWAVGAKTSFSCFGEEELANVIKNLDAENLIISGVEAGICVLQTAIDAVNAGYQVFVIEDAVASRRGEDRCTALKLMRHNGIQVMTAESVLFMLLGSSGHPAFKAVSKLVK